MRCQACEKNETSLAVVCESCKAYYASIREGHYAADEIAVGDARASLSSWTRLASGELEPARSPGPKAAPRFLKRGKKPVPVEPDEPTWQQQVVPLAAAAAPVTTLPEAEASQTPEAPFEDAGLAPELPEAPAFAEAEPAEALPLPAPELPELEAPADEIASVTPPAFATFLADLAPEAPEAEPAPAPAPDWQQFLTEIAPVEPPEEAVPQAPERPASGALASFFESLGTEEPTAAAPTAAAEPPTLDLFFDTLKPADEPSVTLELPGEGDAFDFFAAIQEPAPLPAEIADLPLALAPEVDAAAPAAPEAEAPAPRRFSIDLPPALRESEPAPPAKPAFQPPAEPASTDKRFTIDLSTWLDKPTSAPASEATMLDLDAPAQTGWASPGAPAASGDEDDDEGVRTIEL